MKPRIAVFTDDPGWHGRRLRRAFAARGCTMQTVSLRDCAVDLSAPGGLRIPGFGRDLPDAAFVRGVPGGTLEQVVLRLDVLHALQALGVPVYNRARAIEVSVDKAMTSLLLHRSGVPTPPTWAFDSEAQARSLVLAETGRGHELVLKPLFGSQGKGLRRIAQPADLPSLQDCNGIYYLQRFIGPRSDPGEDYRVLVVGGSARAAMTRRGAGWIHNVAQGAICLPAPRDAELAELAQAAVQALDMDYAGVDLMRGGDGRLMVIEVNSVPAWKGLQTQTGSDIAQMLVDDLLGRCLRSGWRRRA